MCEFRNSLNINFKSSMSNLTSGLHSLNNGHGSNGGANSGNSRQQHHQKRHVGHLRIEDEDVIYKKYDMGKKLGQGSFGVVYEVKNKETGEKFAMKIINKEKAGSKFNFENEVVIMKSVSHRNLIRLEEVYESKKKFYLVTELCEAGELAKWIKKQGPIPEHESRIIMRQIVEAINYLHKHDIVHRDLKLENILLKEFNRETETFFVKITDFGLSTQRQTAGTESMFEDFCGTPLYMAPEIIDNYPYSQLCDVWALGIIMYILLTSHSPFHAESESKLREQIRKLEIDHSSTSYKKLSPEAKDCLNRMMRVNPAHRITCSELFDHAWFLNKKLDEMHDRQKNVLELMSEMLQEQENRKSMLQSSSIKDLDLIKSGGGTGAGGGSRGGGDDSDIIVPEKKKPVEKSSSAQSRHQTLTPKSSNTRMGSIGASSRADSSNSNQRAHLEKKNSTTNLYPRKK